MRAARKLFGGRVRLGGETVFRSQVIEVGKPLPDLSENQVLWSNTMEIRKVVKNGTVDYRVEFAHPSKDAFDDLVQQRIIETVANLPR